MSRGGNELGGVCRKTVLCRGTARAKALRYNSIASADQVGHAGGRRGQEFEV